MNISEEVLVEVKKAAPEGRLSCADAHALAKTLGVDLIIIGRAADELKIRIKNCQLGCF